MRVLKSASLLMVPLVILGLTPTAPPMSRAAAPGPTYVAMGSSFAAGPGIAPAEAGGPAKCVRSADNYANLVAEQLGDGLTDVTCTGATTADILSTEQDGQPPQIDAVRPATKLVTVTIGGNDIDYFGSMAAYSCRDGGGKKCHAVDVATIDRALSVLTRRLENVVTAIRARAPHARVLLVSYFTVLPASGACAGVPLNARHLGFERSLAATLAGDSATAARATGATLVDLATASEQHNACSPQPWVNRYDVTSGNWPYHPNIAGMVGAARLIEQSLTAAGNTAPGGTATGGMIDATPDGPVYV